MRTLAPAPRAAPDVTVCINVNICACGLACLLPDSPGQCVYVIP